MQESFSKSIHEVADICNCSAGYVSMVLNQKRNDTSPLAKKIKQVARALRESELEEERRKQAEKRKLAEKFDSER